MADDVRRMSLSSLKASSVHFWAIASIISIKSSANVLAGACADTFGTITRPMLTKAIGLGYSPRRVRCANNRRRGKAELAPGHSTLTLPKLHTYRNIPDYLRKAGLEEPCSPTVFSNKTRYVLVARHLHKGVA